MRALVLTFDKYRAITEHMIFMYNKVWPEHPFVFRIPYQKDKQMVHSNQLEFKQTDADIRSTVLSLIYDLPDEEWVYWCIDDKYPVNINTKKVTELMNYITGTPSLEISGILFCRTRSSWKKRDYLTGYSVADSYGNKLLERKDYRNIWIHQFLKVKVLRFLFESFPTGIPFARVMDELKRGVGKPGNHQLFTTYKNYAVFGESTSGGRLTRNCYESIIAHSLSLPTWRGEFPNKIRFIGYSKTSYWVEMQKRRVLRLMNYIKRPGIKKRE